ncbi:DUF433 domain-containing protein [Roseofilum sp. BLCC_M154]|uniref:DUF433 domain-containing protein n=1 Tax=Roseofilum acuticapitatum BLCC-M154 TaxID=3022444 RepID=A0ABT7AZ10_9CYAN|nr:DUF433 domain-containing protein [Roseofilum acuticapitatum]MDJ1172153.1 DUF433 domain-containing protein [Roseofilum acuticapitatum BLCC-M154]
MSDANVIGAFSEQQICKLSGLSKYQVSRWRRAGFVSPEYKGSPDARGAYSNVYSFKDLLILRVLGNLNKNYNVPYGELKRAGKKLNELGLGDWASTRIWVLGKRVVFDDPATDQKFEATSDQFVIEIALEAVTSSAREAIREYNERGDDRVAVIEKKRQLKSSQEVFGGTRITVKAIQGYIQAGYSNDQIISDFPDLTDKDVELARSLAA